MTFQVLLSGCRVERLWPYASLQVLDEGPDTWAYQFGQLDGQVTTVVWTTPETRGKSWNENVKGKFDIGDVCGSLVNTPASQKLSEEPLYYIENYATKYKKPTHHGKHLTPDEREVSYTRCSFPDDVKSSVTISEGWDWSLPEYVKPEEQSGFFNFNETPSKDINVIGWHPKWKDWHIGPNQYDFSSMEKKLKEAHEKGFKVGIRLQSVNKQNVPQWLLDKYHPAESTIPGPLKLRIVAPWDENVRKEFEEFIREFGRRGFAKDPAFAFASIHGISEATGEEFGLATSTIQQFEKETGLNPENFRAWVIGRLNVWADAFGENANKLGWVGGNNFGFGDYSQVARDATQLCLERGIGGRGGFVEMYNYKLNEPIMGQKLTPEGYVEINESRFTTSPYIADENEEYISVKRWRFGLLEEDVHRWRISTLRTLQMRCNYISTNPMSMDIDRQLTEYARHSFGKTIDNTPDAWCFLREAITKGSGDEPAKFKNLERWLIQRDVPGGMTQPADRIERTYSMSTDPDGVHHEFNARRTDIASGNKFIAFNLDDRFRTDKGVLLKVTYLDDAKVSWSVQHTAQKADAQRSMVKNIGDGKIKTATFHLPDAQFSNALPDGQDIRLVTEGPGDVTVHLVRIIRKQE